MNEICLYLLIKSTISKKQLNTIFIDFQNGFDKVNHVILLQKLNIFR